MVAAELAWRKAQATVFDWHEHHTVPCAVDQAQERYDQSRRRFEKMRSKLWSMQAALFLAGPN
jgi:hypothetical protein